MKLKHVNKRLKKLHDSLILSIADTSLITSTVLTGGISTAALTSGVGLPVAIALGGLAYFFPL